MKRKILNTSFRFFSFLAEKTGGWHIFVQPKLWLGAIILSTISLNSCSKDKEPEPTCYDPTPTCYLVGPITDTDTISINEPPEEPILCYVQANPNSTNEK